MGPAGARGAYACPAGFDEHPAVLGDQLGTTQLLKFAVPRFPKYLLIRRASWYDLSGSVDSGQFVIVSRRFRRGCDLRARR